MISNDTSKTNESLRDYIWYAEYNDSTFLREFNGIIENSFNDIDDDKVVNFGLIGKNKLDIHFNVNDGILYIGNTKVEIIVSDYKNSEQSEQIDFSQSKKDLITFKHAIDEFNIRTQRTKIIIDAHYIGYKTKIKLNDGNDLHLKIILNFLMNGGISCGVELSSFELICDKQFMISMKINDVVSKSEIINLMNNNTSIVEFSF